MLKITSNLYVNDKITLEPAELPNKNIPVNEVHINARYFHIIRTGLWCALISLYRAIVRAILDYK